MVKYPIQPDPAIVTTIRIIVIRAGFVTSLTTPSPHIREPSASAGPAQFSHNLACNSRLFSQTLNSERWTCGFQGAIQDTLQELGMRNVEALFNWLFVRSPSQPPPTTHCALASHLGLHTTTAFTNSARVHYHEDMSRFHRDDAPSSCAARQTHPSRRRVGGNDRMSQSTLAQSGRRAVSADLLERILRAADYRLLVPLARHVPGSAATPRERGLGTLRAGSVARGTDGFELVTLT